MKSTKTPKADLTETMPQAESTETMTTKAESTETVPQVETAPQTKSTEPAPQEELPKVATGVDLNKKTDKANLANKRGLFLEIGFIVALSVVILAFAYTPKEYRIEQVELVYGVVAEQMVEVTRQEEQKKPSPPKRVEMKVLSTLLEVVTNETVVETEVDFSEFDEDTAVLESVEGSAEAVEDDTPFFVAETMPSFMGGGLDKFHKWVQENVRYPQIAQENGISGRVVVSFIIEKNGELSSIEVLQSPDSSLGGEAVRVLKMSPRWTPGKQRNQMVRVKFTLPVVFSIN